MGDRKEEIGTAIAILRLARGWSQQDLAAGSGLRSGTISDYERGKMTPGLSTARKLLAAMGYPFAALDATFLFLERLDAGTFEESPPAGDGIQEVSAEVGRAASQFARLTLELLARGG